MQHIQCSQKVLGCLINSVKILVLLGNTVTVNSLLTNVSLLGQIYDERVDIFSFGIMLCEVSTAADSFLQMITQLFFELLLWTNKSVLFQISLWHIFDHCLLLLLDNRQGER